MLGCALDVERFPTPPRYDHIEAAGTEMELSDFVIGETFWTHSSTFRCTDIGTCVVVAVRLGPREKRID